MAPSPPRPTRASLPTASFLEAHDSDARQPRVATTADNGAGTGAGAGDNSNGGGATGGGEVVRRGVRSAGAGVVIGASSSSRATTPNRSGGGGSRVREPLVPVVDLSGLLFVAPTTADRGG